MTIQEILDLIVGELGTRNQVSPDQALQFLNQVQLIAFEKDLIAFLDYSNFLTIDILNPLGPYSYPTDPLCRKVLGITTLSDNELLFNKQTDNLILDYGMLPNTFSSRRKYIDMKVDVIGRTVTFPEGTEPITDTDFYRWVYYKRPPLIANSQDNANLLIPEEYHYTICVEGTTKLIDNSIWGEKQTTEAPTGTRAEWLEPYFKGWWDALINAVDAGNESNLYSEGQPGL
jgi:hypothetical protein